MMEHLSGAWVIARRDFLAAVRSKAFLLFLAGPLLPFAFGNLFDTNLASDGGMLASPEIQITGDAQSVQAWIAARDRVATTIGSGAVPKFVRRANPTSAEPALTGDVLHPILTVQKDKETALRAAVGPILYDAYLNERQGGLVTPAPVVRIRTSSASVSLADRTLAAHAAQLGLFILTMLLSGILLSSLVEEKTTKTLDVLAAAIPVDAIFFGKLGAVLGVALSGVLVWGAALAFYINSIGPAFVIPEPAVGWLAFTVLGVAYSASVILLFGAVYLGIGAQADTSRDVQTVAMPLTIAQVLVFALASSAIADLNGRFGILAAAFPWSSPFTMIGRAYLEGSMWPHALALLWQAAAIIMTVKLGALVFRINVMKQSGVAWFTRAQREH